MSKKEIVKKALQCEEVHPIPYLVTFTPGAYRKLQEHLNRKDLADFLGNYIAAAVTNTYHEIVPAGLTSDMWEDDFGVVWKGAGVDRGAPFLHPLGNTPSLKSYRFPDPADPRRFNHLEQFLKDNSDLYTNIALDVGLLFERAWYLRGMSDLLMDFYNNPSFVEDLLDNLVDYYVRSIEILGTFSGVDSVCLIDDYGIQQSLVMAPAMWRKFFKPRLATIVDALRKQNILPHLHSCGKVSDLIPDFIEIGIKVLDPLQPETMSVRDVKNAYGNRLAFLGGFSTQRIIPKGTKEEVRKHVEECLEVLGKGGGYIASNGIPIQTDVPLENILTIIEVLKTQQ